MWWILTLSVERQALQNLPFAAKYISRFAFQRGELM
jgi:hypothetical protein